MTRFWTAFRTGRPLYYAAIGMLLLAAVIVIAVLEGDLPELFQYSMRNLRTFYAEHNYLPGYAALYIEESGVPLPAPGDVFVMYVGTHIPQNPVAWVAAGVFGVPYRVFAPSVAVSTAIWAGVMLTLGVKFGPRLAVLLQAHSWVYLIWGAIVVALVAGIYWRQRRAEAEARRSRGLPVESPSS